MIPDYEKRLDKLFVNAFPSDHPAMNDWVKLKFELQEMRKTSAFLCRNNKESWR